MAKRIKKVFSSQPALIRRWAEQVQDEGSCKAFRRLSLTFQGPTLTSEWPVKLNDWQGPMYKLATFAAPGVVLANSDYSHYIATSSYHRSCLQRVLRNVFPHIKRFDVPSEAMFAQPVDVLQALVNRRAYAMGLATRSRSRLTYRAMQYEECNKQVREYAEHYGLSQPPDMLTVNEQGENKLRYRMAKAMVIENKRRAERGW